MKIYEGRGIGGPALPGPHDRRGALLNLGAAVGAAILEVDLIQLLATLGGRAYALLHHDALHNLDGEREFADRSFQLLGVHASTRHSDRRLGSGARRLTTQFVDLRVLIDVDNLVNQSHRVCL